MPRNGPSYLSERPVTSLRNGPSRALGIGRHVSSEYATRLEEDERDAAFDLWQTARAIADAERLERFPRNDQSCVRWGRSCPYFAACTHETSLDDPDQFRRITKTHEELEAA